MFGRKITYRCHDEWWIPGEHHRIDIPLHRHGPTPGLAVAEIRAWIRDEGVGIYDWDAIERDYGEDAKLSWFFSDFATATAFKLRWV